MKINLLTTIWIWINTVNDLHTVATRRRTRSFELFCWLFCLLEKNGRSWNGFCTLCIQRITRLPYYKRSAFGCFGRCCHLKASCYRFQIIPSRAASRSREYSSVISGTDIDPQTSFADIKIIYSLVWQYIVLYRHCRFQFIGSMMSSAWVTSNVLGIVLAVHRMLSVAFPSKEPIYFSGMKKKVCSEAVPYLAEYSMFHFP